jgi:hypothetical protein
MSKLWPLAVIVLKRPFSEQRRVRARIHSQLRTVSQVKLMLSLVEEENTIVPGIEEELFRVPKLTKVLVQELRLFPSERASSILRRKASSSKLTS